ncbi:MAG: zinc-ribbon domain-containing protein [Myxococcales bacterium]|nr:zinc-ribbon domain-containing protein [Myxococcota bacterium]MDW8283477.1 zinc-ribbon domain-containing protein [Myxococcales bacterium]
MEITCPACQTRFALPAARIPRTPFRVACGKCRHQFLVHPAEASQAAPSATSPGGLPATGAGPPPAAGPAPGGGRTEEAREIQPPPLEEFQEGLRLALVCDDQPERREAVCAALRELDFKPHIAPRPREALAWIYQCRYQLLLLHEDFGATPGTESPLLLGLAPLPMAQRRHICVGLYGKALRTMDHAAAFHKSVHFVFNERDLPRVKSIVRSALADNDQFYRVFREVLAQVGRI